MNGQSFERWDVSSLATNHSELILGRKCERSSSQGRTIYRSSVVGYLMTERVGERVWNRAHRPTTERRALATRVEQSQFSAFVVAEAATVASLVVVRRKLAQQLSNSILLTGTAGVRHLRLRQHTHVLMYLHTPHHRIATCVSVICLIIQLLSCLSAFSQYPLRILTPFDIKPQNLA